MLQNSTKVPKKLHTISRRALRFLRFVTLLHFKTVFYIYYERKIVTLIHIYTYIYTKHKLFYLYICIFIRLWFSPSIRVYISQNKSHNVTNREKCMYILAFVCNILVIYLLHCNIYLLRDTPVLKYSYKEVLMTDSKRGRPSCKVDIERLKTLLDLEVPKTKIAKSLGIGRATLYRLMEREGLMSDS